MPLTLQFPGLPQKIKEEILLRTHRLATLAAGITLAATLPLASPASAAPPSGATAQRAEAATAPVVVVRNLNNPRQLASYQGALLIAEAGSGGDECVTDENNVVQCIGMTGSISLVRRPSQVSGSEPFRVATGLLSRANPNGSSAGGPSAFSVDRHGRAFAVIADRPGGELPDTIDSSTFGKLITGRPGGTPWVLADVTGYEAANDPDGQGYESNPYGLLVQSDRVLIADAAANDILQWKNGRLSTFAVLPNVSDGSCAGKPNQGGTTGCDPVPTSLAVDSNGSIYVGAATDLSAGTARVYQLNGRTGSITKVWTGLTAVTGVAVGRDGSVYASQLFTEFGPTGPVLTSGKVTKLRPDGTRTDTAVPLPGGLVLIDNALYASAFTNAPATGLGLPGIDSSGQVWRLGV